MRRCAPSPGAVSCVLEVPRVGVCSHLSRKRDGSAVDVDHAVGKIVSVLAEAHADAFCWRVRLARRMVGT